MRVLAIAVIWLCFLPLWAQERQSCYVFMPSVNRPRAVQDELKTIFPELEMVVFGRVQEFYKRIQEDPPELVITYPAVIAELTIFSSELNGQRAGTTSEPYMLVSVDSGTATGEGVIGVVDILGRRSMQQFVAQITGESNPKLRMVSKLEDLLTLLQFQDVDTILVSSSQVDFFRQRSRLGLKVEELPNVRSPLPTMAVAAQVSNRAELLDLIKSRQGELATAIGVERWVEP
ncbi:MAG: hypothetical protein KDC35_06805 [Acidobacteria bacterium]|nr:hypothetical protein [Acidobacteriota bacterium]